MHQYYCLIFKKQDLTIMDRVATSRCPYTDIENAIDGARELVYIMINCQDAHI